MIYLDYVSSTPLNPEIEKTYLEVLSKYYANSEAIHDLGREVNSLVEKSRAQIARLFNVKNNEIIFTSGASESNNLAIKGVALKNSNKGKHIISSSYEHSSVMASLKQLEELFGFEVTYLKPNEDGIITLDEVKKNLRDDTILVSLMYVNNEIGAINPINEISEYVKKHSNAYMHVDAVQALGKYKIETTYPDLITLSMHKIYGLKGSGILIKKAYVQIASLISGGSQEFGLRGGTLNAASDIVCAKTIRLALQDEAEHFKMVSVLHDYLYDELSKIDGVLLNSPQNGSKYIINFSYPKIRSEIMMNALNNEGFAISAKSTCDLNSLEPSHVLKTMGYDNDRCLSSIRVGLSFLVKKEELDSFIKSLKGIIDLYG